MLPPDISPSLSDETVSSHWDMTALLPFSALHSWVLIAGNTKKKKIVSIKSMGQPSQRRTKIRKMYEEGQRKD